MFVWLTATSATPDMATAKEGDTGIQSGDWFASDKRLLIAVCCLLKRH